jgi:hypothetical protein
MMLIKASFTPISASLGQNPNADTPDRANRLEKLIRPPTEGLEELTGGRNDLFYL